MNNARNEVFGGIPLKSIHFIVRCHNEPSFGKQDDHLGSNEYTSCRVPRFDIEIHLKPLCIVSLHWIEVSLACGYFGRLVECS
jgi:hypothetical protein